MPSGKYIRTPEIREKISKSLRGNIPWNKGKKRPPFSQKWKDNSSKAGKGKKFTEEHKKKIGEAQAEDKGHNWKGNNVGYEALHGWVSKHRGKPNVCEFCKRKVFDKRKIHWANVDHKYKRVLEDFIRLCHSCHREYDKRFKKQ